MSTFKFNNLIISVLIFHCVSINNAIAQGGFGGITYKAELGHAGNMMLVGGEGAWVINNRFYLGGGGYGNVNTINIEGDRLESFGYGGVKFGYIHSISNRFRLGIELFNASGSYTYGNSSHSLFLMEPQLRAWFPVNHYMQFTAGIYHRFTFQDESSPLNSGSLDNVGITISLLFGKFN